MDDREEAILSALDLERHMGDIVSRDYSDFWLVQRGSSMKGFEKLLYRALGLRTETDGRSVYVLSSPEGSVVVFLDEDFNEQRAVNPNATELTKEEVVFELANGERAKHRADEVVPRELAFDSVRYFFEHGERPPFLRYRSAGRRSKQSKRK